MFGGDIGWCEWRERLSVEWKGTDSGWNGKEDDCWRTRFHRLFFYFGLSFGHGLYLGTIIASSSTLAIVVAPSTTLIEVDVHLGMLEANASQTLVTVVDAELV
ncbi:hypothetical protein ACH5RR_003033 [Cinchona calisaya]|uniref:Uncharacterized protein n=1 Tax=Cinchona calisaya TaxID=153742 RepID=A0ABD3ATP0_9GENT